MLNLPLCHWSSQLFDLRAPSSSDVPVLIGSLSNDDDDDDDGRVNVAKKLNLRPFKLYRLYLDLLNLSNVFHSFWSWIDKDFVSRFKTRKNNLLSYVYVPRTTTHQEVSRLSRAVHIKKFSKCIDQITFGTISTATNNNSDEFIYYWYLVYY